ncbi:MAG: hypothetical protein GX802_06270 [Clostridiales bacterium]|nr:hypothetical protein [Clostridiales bacterium]
MVLESIISLSFTAPASSLVMGWSVPAFLCLLVGMILMVIEMFMPGFGVAGGLGFIAIIVAIILRANTFGEGLLIAAIIIVFLIIVGIIVYHSFTKGMISRSSLMLNESIEGDSTSLKKDSEKRVGRVGKTISYLRPTGIADFDGERLDVLTAGEFIEVGTEVVITNIEGIRIIVKRYTPEAEIKENE